MLVHPAEVERGVVDVQGAGKIRKEFLHILSLSRGYCWHTFFFPAFSTKEKKVHRVSFCPINTFFCDEHHSPQQEQTLFKRSAAGFDKVLVVLTKFWLFTKL